MLKVKENMQVDEELRAYVYEDKIEFVEFTSGIEIPENNISLKDFCGILFIAYIKEDKICCIEDKCMNIITRANKTAFIFLASLIDIKIDDFNITPKLESANTEFYEKV